MGRGRAKAKQTKVARQLKYSSPDMNLDQLQRELANQAPRRSYSDAPDDEDQYADHANWDEDDDTDQRAYGTR